MWQKISLKSRQVCYITLIHKALRGQKDQLPHCLAVWISVCKNTQQFSPLPPSVVNQTRRLLL